MVVKYDKLNNTSSHACMRATGKSWDEWINLLNQTGADKWTHKEIVVYLNRKYQVPPWWRQMVTNGYEKAIGRRVEGQTQDADFQIGITKTIEYDPKELWNKLFSGSGLKLWLGEINGQTLKVGSKYITREGTSGEVKSLIPGKRIRLTWKPKSWKKTSTLQLTLNSTPTPDKTSIRFHQESLSDQKIREEMRSHWQGVISSLQQF
jgi:uncharacterized protein YndB with AHSA1/START domain